jgi:predicted dehydrogenase
MRIGTVGTNFIVDRFIDAVRRTTGAEIAAVYSRQVETAAAFAQKHGILRIFTDRDHFLSDQNLDFIYVASPNSLHYSWARDALLAGRNVICEKPFTSTAAELEDLIALARGRGLFLFEALTTSHLPNYRRIKELMPLIAPVKVMELNFSKYSPRYTQYLKGENPNIFSPDFSGGALMDMNYYNLAFVQGILGSPDDMRYYANRGANGIDTSGVLIMAYPGCIAVLSCCKDADGRSFVHLRGEQGYICASASSSNLEGGFTLCRNGVEEHYNDQTAENILCYEMADFIQVFKQRDRNYCETSLAESLKVMTLTERARIGAGINFPADKLR